MDGRFSGNAAERVENGLQPAGGSGHSWRTLVISVVVAVVLSLMAALLLGGAMQFHCRGIGATGERGVGAIASCPGEHDEKAR